MLPGAVFHGDIPALSDVTNMGGRTEKWITRLVDGLNEHVDTKTRALILEQCGRQCQSPVFIKKKRDSPRTTIKAPARKKRKFM